MSVGLRRVRCAARLRLDEQRLTRYIRRSSTWNDDPAPLAAPLAELLRVVHGREFENMRGAEFVGVYEGEGVPEGKEHCPELAAQALAAAAL